ncbi:Probable C-mannosyltransferase DPY19L3 [Apodemus speciosus]|uniref:Probable C-mannosyltransferase DPY19L3 n=1 Tax=Apodemus speciosus TaxID=105296 RepID=A0ABQ0EY36_APOSI
MYIRQRKETKPVEVSEDFLSPKEDAKLEKKLPSEGILGCASGRFWKILSSAVGATVALCIGLLTSVYLATLHENDLWFSNIKEVEREISFRTECGLYYSYYKQMLQAPTLLQGFHVLPIQKYLEPVYFYIYTLFGLQAVYVTALYVTSWLLSGTWLSGLLAALWYITNRIDTTRVEFTIPLRENWALPFFAIQIAAITYFLRPNLQPLSEVLTWQFNQFMMLLQALVLFILDSLDMLPAVKATWLYGIQVSCLLLVCALQFFNSMILGSLLISFNLSVLIVRKFQKNLKTGSFLTRIWKLLLHLLLVCCLTLILNNVIKKILNLKSDEHIFKFLKAKFGFGATRDFDANLYLCEEAFGLLPLSTFQRLSDTLLFHAYMFVLLVTVVTAAVVAFHNLSLMTFIDWKRIMKHCDPASLQSEGQTRKRAVDLKPETAYNLIHTILFGVLALSTMRMKYLWTSHMCVFASFGLCSSEIWELLLRLVHLCNPKRIWVMRYSVPVLTLLYLCCKSWPGMMDELSELKEFYDPDTVELMTWINSNTPRKAVFAGSMQLLAGVKLCTGRTLTNHPHYEDKSLRERTQAVYQIYAKRSPEEVHALLRSFGADFVILEDSICYERRHHRGCRLRDLLDVANGHEMDGPGESDPDLRPADHPRFCEEIKRNLPSYAAHFTRVFQNKTFHVYKLSRNK